MKSPRSIMPEAPPEADLPLAEDQPSAEAAGYLFIPSPFLRERAGVRVDFHHLQFPPHPFDPSTVLRAGFAQDRPNPLPHWGEREFVWYPVARPRGNLSYSIQPEMEIL